MTDLSRETTVFFRGLLLVLAVLVLHRAGKGKWARKGEGSSRGWEAEGGVLAAARLQGLPGHLEQRGAPASKDLPLSKITGSTKISHKPRRKIVIIIGSSKKHRENNKPQRAWGLK